MVAPTKPRKVQSKGKDSWFLVPTIADPDAPTALEINSVSGINISCAVLAEGDSLTKTTNKVTLPAYLCEVDQYEGLDRATWSMGDVVGGFDPQAADGVRRQGSVRVPPRRLRRATRFVVRQSPRRPAPRSLAQFVDVVPVSIDEAAPGTSGTDASAIYVFRAGVAVTGKPSLNVEVA